MPELTIPECTTSNFESFVDKFKSAVFHMYTIHGVHIGYLLREADGNYNYNWTSRK